MKKLLVILALAVLLVPGIIMAQPPGCNWSGGDPVLMYGWDSNNLPWQGAVGENWHFLLRGMQYSSIVRGRAFAVNGTWNYFSTCCYNATDTDTFCYTLTEKRGWNVTVTPPVIGQPYRRAPNAWMDPLTITVDVPVDAPYGTRDTLIVGNAFHNVGTCAPQCGDCENPNVSMTLYNAGYPSAYYIFCNKDTLIIEVISSPVTIEQDSITLVDQGQTQAYIPFDIRNWTSEDGMHYYTISNTGTVGGVTSVFDSIIVAGDDREPVYLPINAGLANICDYDELTIIAWRFFDSVMYYDTCVQLIHVIEPRAVPLFTVPVVTILVLALILAAAVFMRRRAVSKA